MRQHREQSRRTWGARACLAAMALTWAVVPGLHALVHHREAEEGQDGGREERPGLFSHRPFRQVVVDRGRRGEAHRDGDARRRPIDGESHDHDHGGPRGHHHHHHHGDPRTPESPLDHGSGAPEHFGLALLESDAPAIPIPGQPVDSLAPASPEDRPVAAVRRGAHGSRAPPRDLAFQPSA